MKKQEFMQRLRIEADCCCGVLVAWIWSNKSKDVIRYLFRATFPLTVNYDRVRNDCWRMWKEDHRKTIRRR